MTFDGHNIDIDLLVKRVLGDLGLAVNHAPVRPPSAPSVASDSKSAAQQPSQKTVSSAACIDEESDAVLEIRLSDRVISMATIKKAAEEPSARGVRRVVVANRAIVTPSVRDEMKKRRWELVFEPSSERRPAIPAVPTKPFVPMKSSELRDGALMLAFHLLPPETLPKSLLDGLNQSGLTTVYRNPCVIETAIAVERYVGETAAGKAIVFTAYPAAASAILNRRRVVRALVGYDPARMEEESAQLGANALVIDPKRTGFYAVQRMVRRFFELGSSVCPEILRRGLE